MDQIDRFFDIAKLLAAGVLRHRIAQARAAKTSEKTTTLDLLTGEERASMCHTAVSTPKDNGERTCRR